MQAPERLNYEIRDRQGNIVAATQDRGIAEIVKRMVSRTEIYECNWQYSHRAWFPCDFTPYFSNPPKEQVVIEDTVYQAKRKELTP